MMCIFQITQKTKEGKISESDAQYLFDLFMGRTVLTDGLTNKAKPIFASVKNK